MAKKVRGSRSKHQPGGQGPSHSKKTSESSPTTEAVATPVETEADIDMALDIVAMQATEIDLSEPLAPAAPVAKSRKARRGAKIKADSLEARAAAEGGYVREDLRKIAIISSSLLIGLLIAWAILVPMNLIGLY